MDLQSQISISYKFSKFINLSSGNLVFESHRFITDMEELTVAATHGSPWCYDTFVPIIFAGYGLDDDVVYQQVCTLDIDITLSVALKIKLPSGAIGQILPKILY